MFRFSKSVKQPLKSKIAWKWSLPRQQSSMQDSSGTKKGTKVLLTAVGGTGTILAGAVGYCAWSPDNRKTLGNVIPGSKMLINLIWSEDEELPVKEKQPQFAWQKPEPLKDKKLIEAAKLENKEEIKEYIKPDSEHEKLSAASKKDKDVQSEQPTSTEEVKKVEDITAEKESLRAFSAEDVGARLAAAEAEEAAVNLTLSKQLKELKATAQHQVVAALAAAEAAAEAARKHAEQAYSAIDTTTDVEKNFAAVAELSNIKGSLMKTAEEKIEAAKLAVEELKSQVSSGHLSDITQNNKDLLPADESVADLSYSLSKIDTLVADAIRDSKVVHEYRQIVEDGVKQFESEVRALLPDVKLHETSDKLTKEELNLLLAHAHRKVLQLQKQLAKQQTVAQEQFKETLRQQRSEEAEALGSKVKAELEKQRHQLHLQYRQQTAHIQEELEAELRAQLKRQAAAHSDHLADVLSVQEKELEIKWQSKVNDAVQDERDQHLKSLSELRGQVNGLQTAVTTRAEVDRAGYQAHKVWVACQSLQNALRLGKENATSWEEKIIPLQEQAAVISASAGANEFVETVLGSISSKTFSRGVYTEEALRERFIKVARTAKRVALIGENGGSLMRYLLSYMQSFLIVDSSKTIPTQELRDQEIDSDALSVHDILARTKYCLDKDDLAQAVRYMNLLRGEPQHVVADWLQEARLTLEVKQAAFALMAYAAATAVQVI